MLKSNALEHEGNKSVSFVTKFVVLFLSSLACTVRAPSHVVATMLVRYLHQYTVYSSTVIQNLSGFIYANIIGEASVSLRYCWYTP
jgi:hypothetical protein